MLNPRKPVFDAVKAELPQIWNDRGNILAMDNLLDAFGFPREASSRRTSARGVALIHGFESCRLKAYPDPGSGGRPWTIGWGNTTDEQGRPIKPGTVWTRERADARFEQFLAGLEAEVNGLLGSAPTTQSQFDAMVSFAYNLGTDIDLDDVPEGLGDSTLLKKHLAGDHDGAAREFAKWNRAGGRVLAGLTRRRAAEATLYLSGRA